MMPVLYLITVFLIEYREFRKRRTEYRELEHFAEFLSDLRFEFYLCKSVTESIFRAAERVPGGLRKTLEEICFLLESEDAGDTVAEYQYPGYLKYLKLFVIQCRSAVQYGSGKNSTESAFVKNMTELRKDVQNECYKRAQSGFLFAGMGIVAAVPVVFLPVIRRFGCATMEELKSFYEGSFGKLTAMATGIITLCCYAIVIIVRKTGGRAEQIAGKRLAAADINRSSTEYRMICIITGIFLSLCMVCLMRKAPFGQKIIAAAIGFFVGAFMTAGFYRYLGYLRKLGMGGEVLGLQSMILLLVDVPDITIMQVLDALGDYAELFRKTVLRCADSYAAEDARALERMYEEEEYPAFRQLAGRIAVSEQVGLARAFSEIAADRQFFREQQRLEMEQELKKKAANAQVAAFFPLMFLLFAYLIFPFLAVSLGQMGEILKEMGQFHYF